MANSLCFLTLPSGLSFFPISYPSLSIRNGLIGNAKRFGEGGSQDLDHLSIGGRALIHESDSGSGICIPKVCDKVRRRALVLFRGY